MGGLESEPSEREIRRIKQESRGGRKATLDRGDSAGKHGVMRMADMCRDQGRPGSWEHRGRSKTRGTPGATSGESKGLDFNWWQQAAS